MRVLITGGAGFIGSHLVEALVGRGHAVRVFDNLSAQVHGDRARWPDCLQVSGSELIRGDIRSKRQLGQALDEVDAVFHLAAETGVGQSMYEASRYVATNSVGAANLMDLIGQRGKQIKRLILASSRAVYGEGKYVCVSCGEVYPAPRSAVQLEERAWNLQCPICGIEIEPVPTDEESHLAPSSIYGISKRNQEEICLTLGQIHGITTIVLRFFNVFGPRQSLVNPYTGIIPLFCARVLNGKPPSVFEDGLESRDFVHVLDVVQACVAALEGNVSQSSTINVGSGASHTLTEVASIISAELGGSEPVVTGTARVGDIRHCTADIKRATTLLGYRPQVSFMAGMIELVEYVRSQRVQDHSERMFIELDKAGLLRGKSDRGPLR